MKLSPQPSNNLVRLPTIYEAFLSALEHNLCLDCACGQTMPEREDIHAKRKRDSSGAATRAGCLGVQMARTRCGWQTKASQNSSRISRTVGRRSGCSSGNFRVTVRVQSWRRVAQNEMDNSLRPCGRITVNASLIRIQSGKRIRPKSPTKVI